MRYTTGTPYVNVETNGTRYSSQRIIWNTPNEILKHTKKHTNDDSNIDTWIGSDSDTSTRDDTEERTIDT